MRARMSEGWLTPLAILAGIVIVAAVTLIASRPLSALAAWEISPSRTHWITHGDPDRPRRPREGEASRAAGRPAETRWVVDPDFDRPQRLREGEAPRSVSRLPRAPSDLMIQIFHVAEVTPREELAMLAPAVSGGQVRAFISGVELRRPALETGPSLAAPWSRALLWDAPENFLRPGPDRIDLLIAGSTGRTLNAPIYLGPRAVLQRALETRAAWNSLASRMLPPAGLAVVLAGLLGALLDAKRRAALLAGTALVAAFGARAAMSEQAVIDALGQNWAAADRLLVGLALLAQGPLMTGGRLPAWRPRVFWLLAGGLGLAWGLDFAAPRPAPALASPAAWAAILLPLGLLMLTVATRGGHRWANSTVRRARALSMLAILVLATVLTIWTGLAQYVGLSGLMLDFTYLATVAMTLTGLLAVAGWTAVSGGLRLVRTRLDLSGIVREQRAQIVAAATALEQEMRRAAILEERQRLARDMHDGVGGQLVSLIARVRSRRITIDQVEGELVQGLSELRLVVDSLDAPGQSLADALLTFRLRTQNLADGAGMALDWTQNNLEGAETSDSRWVLTLYRFMQEAVTNAVRHSGGQRLAVRAELTGGRLVVEIADDGRGFNPEEVSAGKGQRNLAFRASQLGGVLTIKSEPGGGTQIRLEAPPPLD